MRPSARPTAIDRERFPVDEWRLIEQSHATDDGELTATLFALGNGFLGMRADPVPDPDSRGTFVNGFHETWPIHYAENAHALARTGQTIVEVPDAKSLALTVGGETLWLDDTADVAGYRRELDFRTGILHSEYTWRTATAGAVRVKSRRLVSLTRRHLAALRLEVTLLDRGSGIEIASGSVDRQDEDRSSVGGDRSDPRRARTFDRRVLVPLLSRCDDPASVGATVVLGFRCDHSEMAIACGYRHLVDAQSATAVTATTTTGDDRATTVLAFEADAGATVSITKLVAYHTAEQAGDVAELAGRCEQTLGEARASGWDDLVAEQRTWLDGFWARGDIVVDGDPEAQQAIRWNLFQLAQASATTGVRGIAAKAVTAGGYEGHYFWDTEIYLIPFLAVTNPDAARDLLLFRHRLLPAARRRAAEMTQRGALYPWRTINGEEASAYFPAGTAQYHIDAAVAYAIERYMTATGDVAFLAHAGAEILVEIARLFEDLGFYDRENPPRFHIHGVTGPDEYTAIVDDNLYTNVMARFTMRYAADCVDLVRRHEPAAFDALVGRTSLVDGEIDGWRRAADAMYVAYDDTLGIHPQDDSFLRHEPWDFERTPADKYPLLLNFHPLVIYRHQVLKQADVVLAMFLRGEEFAPDVQRRNFDYYDPLTTGDSSLSACVQSAMASEVGHADLAMHYFTQSLYLDLADTHGNTGDGVHIANAGGVWAALVHGFAGVRDIGDHLRVAPRLPAGWRALRFRLQRRGSDVAIALDAEGATITVESGAPVPILIDEDRPTVRVESLAPGATIRIPHRAR